MKTSSYSAFRSISVLNESNTIFYFLSILVYVLFPFTLGQQEDTMRSNSFFHLLQYVLCITAILPDVFFKEAFTFLQVATCTVISSCARFSWTNTVLFLSAPVF